MASRPGRGCLQAEFNEGSTQGGDLLGALVELLHAISQFFARRCPPVIRLRQLCSQCRQGTSTCRQLRLHHQERTKLVKAGIPGWPPYY